MNDPFNLAIPAFNTPGLSTAAETIRAALEAKASGPTSQNAAAGAQSLAEVLVKLAQG
jgi:hypothetical protein